MTYTRERERERERQTELVGVIHKVIKRRLVATSALLLVLLVAGS